MSENKMSLKERFGIIKRTIKLIEKADKGHIRRNFVDKIPDIISTFSGIFLASLIIDGVTDGKPAEYLLTAAAVVCGIELISVLIQVINNKNKQAHGTLYYRNVERMICKKVLDMDYSKIEDIETQNKLDNAKTYIYNSNTGIPALTGHLSAVMSGIVQICLGFALAAPVLFVNSAAVTDIHSFLMSGWGAAALLIFCGALEIFQAAALNPQAEKYMDQMYTDPKILQAERERSFYRWHTTYNYRNGKEIRLYGEQQLIEKKFLTAHETVVDKILQTFFKTSEYTFIMNLCDLLSKLVLYGFAIYRAVNGSMSAGDVIIFVMCFIRIQYAFESISDNFGSLLTKSQMWKQLYDFLDIPDEKYQGTIPTEKRDDNEYEFEFKHVWFKYPDSEEYTLKDINLKWRIGEKMALVGKNGCGKSTLVKLLCRLYDPTEGDITLNGIDIRKYKYEEYMELFSVVFQDSKLFSFSLAENVAADTEYDAERVTDCVIRAGLGDRLKAMENGIETCLYKDFDENGVEISGGEAQKLCLARAIYKGSPFIVLDEPTAALDPISEYDIYTKFNGIVGTRTAIYISHRLSSCRFCDEITVMDNGRIAERGSHDELLSNGGVYKELWTAQAEYYKDTAGELFA